MIDIGLRWGWLYQTPFGGLIFCRGRGDQWDMWKYQYEGWYYQNEDKFK